MAERDGGMGLPLRIVLERTGLSADVLRTWERRYGVVQPRRTADGQRLYSPDDIERLTLLRAATAAGHSIGELARLDAIALEAIVDLVPRVRGKPTDADIDLVVRGAMSAAERLDASGIEAELRRALLALGVRPLVDRAIGAFLRQIGERWHSGEITPAHEHIASNAVRNTLAWAMVQYAPSARAPRITLATPAGEEHEFGAMLAATAAAEEGWRVSYLGPNLPFKVIASAARQFGARAVALSAVVDNNLREIRALARTLSSDTPVLVGGAAVEPHARALARSGVRVVGEFPAFRRALHSLRRSGRLEADEPNE